MVACRQDTEFAAPDADVQARLFAYGELLGWTAHPYWVPAGHPALVGTPLYLKGLEVGPATRGPGPWRDWIQANSTPLLRDYLEQLLLHDYAQCRELKTSLDEGRFATAGDAIVVIRMSSAHSEQKLALGNRLDQELRDVGCSVVRAHGREVELLRAEFEQLLHAAAHRRGFPQKPPQGLEQHEELLELAARRVCLVGQAHGRVTDVELQAHAPGQSLQNWRDETLRDWDQAFDEWIVRLFAQLRTVVWNRAINCSPPFPSYPWVTTDSRTGQRRPTGEQLAGGEMAWGAALTGMSLTQLEELSTTHVLDRQLSNLGGDAGDQLEHQRVYDVTSLADDRLRELLIAIVDKAGYPRLADRVTDREPSARRDSWRQLVMLRANRADLEDLVSRFPPHLVNPLLAAPAPVEPLADKDIERAKDAFRTRGIESYPARELDDYLAPVVRRYHELHPGLSPEQAEIARLLDVNEQALSRAVNKTLGLNWRAYVLRVLAGGHTVS